MQTGGGRQAGEAGEAVIEKLQEEAEDAESTTEGVCAHCGRKEVHARTHAGAHMYARICTRAHALYTWKACNRNDIIIIIIG